MLVKEKPFEEALCQTNHSPSRGIFEETSDEVTDGASTYAGNGKHIDPVISITADIVSSYVSNNPIPAAELPDFIGKIHASIRNISDGVADGGPDEIRYAVPVKNP